MKIRIIGNNRKVVVEWPEGEGYKIKRLHKKLDKAGMYDVETDHFWKKIDGKETPYLRRTYECVLGPDHEWLEEVFEALSQVGLCPMVACEGKRQFEAIYDDTSHYNAPELCSGATARSALNKAYKAWLKKGRYINEVSLAELLGL